MVLRDLIHKLKKLIDDYKKSNTSYSLGATLTTIVAPAVNLVKHAVIDSKLKQEKILAGNEIEEFLENMLKDEGQTLSTLNKLKEKFKDELVKAKSIRKDNAPGDYDGVIVTCHNVIDRTLLFYHLCDLKNASEKEVAADPRLILEDRVLSFLIDVEIARNMSRASKSFSTKCMEIFSGWGSREERLAEEISEQFQDFLCKIELSCLGIDKNSLQYALIIEANVALALEEDERCRSLGLDIKTLLLQARTQIRALTSYKAVEIVQTKKIAKRREEAEEGVRHFLSGQYEVKNQSEQQRLEEEAKAAKAREQAEALALAQLLQQKIEADAKARTEADAKTRADVERAKADSDPKPQSSDEATKRVEIARAQAEELRRTQVPASLGPAADMVAGISAGAPVLFNASAGTESAEPYDGEIVVLPPPTDLGIRDHSAARYPAAEHDDSSVSDSVSGLSEPSVAKPQTASSEQPAPQTATQSQSAPAKRGRRKR